MFLEKDIKNIDTENLEFLYDVFNSYTDGYKRNAFGDIIFIDDEDELFYRKANKIEQRLFWELKERKNG